MEVEILNANPAKMIHVTGVQRSGHSFIGHVMTVNLGVAFWKQHEDEQWQLRCVIIYDQEQVAQAWPDGDNEDSRHVYTALGPDMSFQTMINNGPVWRFPSTPSSLVIPPYPPFENLNCVRVTEYRTAEWFFNNVVEQSKGAIIHINVVRDPRNVLASAAAKGWNYEHCNDLLDACQFQYTDPTIKGVYRNISYERVLADILSPTSDKTIAGIKISNSSLPGIRNIQRRNGNSSFASVTRKPEEHNFFTRYEREDVVCLPVFQRLIEKAENIYNLCHVPFLNDLKL